MKIETRLARAGTRQDGAWHSVSPPIYQTAIFEHQRPFTEGADRYNYSRIGNPTRTVLEEVLADLEGGVAALAFSTGMAAMSAALHLFQSGDHIIATEGLYGHTYSLLANLLQPMGIRLSFVDTSRIDAIEAAWTDRTAGVVVETPTNPLLKGTDIEAVAKVCRERKGLLIVDSTFLTPLALRPLELGADIVVHSATKYLAGHNDTLAGALITRSHDLAADLSFIRTMTGGTLSPHDAWLTLRGIKTLALRMERAQANALQIARWLQSHPRVAEVHYPGLESHPSHTLFKTQASGFGSVISFAVTDPSDVERILNNTELIFLAESLGGTETLMTFPWSQTHGNVPPEERMRLGIHDRLIRLSVGIESADDLIADLANALEA